MKVTLPGITGRSSSGSTVPANARLKRRSLAIGPRLLIGFGLGLLAFLVLSVISFNSAGQFVETTDWVRHTYEVLAKIQKVNSDVIGVQTAVRGFIITGQDDYLAPYRDAVREQRDDVRTVAQLTADNPRQQRRLITLKDLISQRLAFSEDTLVLRRQHGFTAAAALISSGRSEEIMNKIESTIGAMEREEQELLTGREARSRTRRARTFFILSAGTFIDLGLLLTVLFFLNSEATERRDAEATSRLAADIVNSTGDAVITMTMEGIVTSWNPGAQLIFGYTAREAVGNSVLMFVPPECSDEEQAILAGVGRNERVQFETVRLRKDGRRAQVSVTASPLRDNTGRISGAAKILRDITDSKQAEESLRVSQARLISTLAAGSVGTWTWDIANDLLAADEFTARMFSLELSAAAKGLPVGDYLRAVLEADRAGVADALARAIQSCGHYDVEYRVRQKDGELRWLQARGRVEVDAAGKASHFHGAVMDITERMRTEEALREGEKQFQTMVNAIPQLAWIAEADGSVFWYNQRWFDYTGTTLEQMDGWGWQRVHDPALLPKVMEGWKVGLENCQPFEMEFPLRAVDGHYGWFLTRVFPLKDETGTVIRWFGTNTDLSQKRAADEEIRRLNSNLERRVVERTAELEAANKELEAFSYSVSHDLRAPLRAVDGFSQAVLEDYGGQLPEEGRRDLQTIREGAQRMGALIDDLLRLSQLSRSPLNQQQVNVGKLVDRVLESLNCQREGRQVDIRIGELPECQGDAGLLNQVWVNLISNALKYTRRREAAIIEIGCKLERGENVYFVRDNGAGFNMRYVNKLFGVFQRLHRAEEFEGTGVGLAIVQRIVHRHGGRIWADAALNEGATFSFTLKEKTL